MAVDKLGLKYRTTDVKVNLVFESYRDKINEMIDEIPWTTSALNYIRLIDTNATHYLQLEWDEDDIAHRGLKFQVNSGNRIIALTGNLTVESASLLNQDLTTDSHPTFDDLTLTSSRALQAYRYAFMMMGD